MASTFSPILRIELIGTGDQSGTWGDTTNVNLGTLIEQAIAGTATVDVTAGNVTLTNYNGATDQARCASLRVTGTPGTTRNIIAPAVSKLYVVINGSDSNVVLKTSTSTGLTVPDGEVYLAVYDTTSLDFKLVGTAGSSANIPDTLVRRDASGNFAAGTITATFVGDLAGTVNGEVGNLVPNAGTFTTLTTYGTTVIGDTSADALTVNATPTFNVKIPVTSLINGTATGTGDIVLATNPTITGATVNGNVVGANSVGARTIQATSAGVPTGGSSGDIVYQY